MCVFELEVHGPHQLTHNRGVNRRIATGRGWKKTVQTGLPALPRTNIERIDLDKTVTRLEAPDCYRSYAEILNRARDKFATRDQRDSSQTITAALQGFAEQSPTAHPGVRRRCRTVPAHHQEPRTGSLASPTPTGLPRTCMPSLHRPLRQ